MRFPAFPLRLVCLLSLLVGTAVAEEADQPIPLIFDTDIGNDVDDVLALGVIHALQSRGECELLAVTITKDNKLAAPFVDAINTFYGRGNIRIGVCDSGITKQAGRYLELAQRKTADGDFRYPHDLLSGEEAPPAVAVLRRALAQAEDGSVVIVQVGFSTNLANLLASKPDDISPLNGQELVAKKVRLLSMMAGYFAPDAAEKSFGEYNVKNDLDAARTLAASWPTPIVYSGWEVGHSLPYPHESIEQDYGYVKHHPLAEAYYLYNPPPHNRPTWDLTSVLYAVRPDRGYFNVSPPGKATVADDASTSFHEQQGANRRYLTIPDEGKDRILEALQILASQPPTVCSSSESSGEE